MSRWDCVQSPWKPQQHCVEGVIKHVCCYKRPQQRRSHVWADMYIWCDNIPDWISSHPRPTTTTNPPPLFMSGLALLDSTLTWPWHSTGNCLSLVTFLFVPSCLSIWALIRFCWTCAAECVHLDLVAILAVIPVEHIVVNTDLFCLHIFFFSLSGSEFQRHYRGFPPLRMTLFFLRAEECNR